MTKKSAGSDLHHLRSLDSLRGIAVLAVILLHCAVLSGQQGFFWNLCFTGQRGVQLFYVISAFTLYYSLSVRKEESRPLLFFFIRRFFRIAPLYYLAIIINLFYQGLAPRAEAPMGLHVYDVLSGFFFLNGFSPDTVNSIAIGGWSIAVETTFYILLPFIFNWITTFKKALYLTLISGIGIFILTRLVWHYGGLHTEYREFLYFLSFPIEFPVFCMGILAFMIWSKFIKNSVLMPDKKPFSLLMLGTSIILLVSNFPFSNNNLHLTSFAFIPLVLGLLLYEWPLFVNRVTLYLGKISYSIYLMHFFIIIGTDRFIKTFMPQLFDHYLGSRLFLIALFVAVTILACIVCSITYYVIEKPAVTAGKKLIKYLDKNNHSKMIIVDN